METLSARFTVLQEKLMDIYESGVEDLDTQIQHWQLLRQEQIIYHYARKHGVTRLGYQPVPSLASSEAKAKDAISMVLLLESLNKSNYADERWTLAQTSLEAVRSPPADCFKKGPKNIEVIFDGDPENLMSYTVWTYIYYMTDEDTWEKVEGHVDYTGAYYYEGNLKVYYLKFENDAKRYGVTGLWEVRVNKDTVFTPVTSSTPPVGDSTDSASRAALPEPSTSVSPERPRSQTARRYGRKASSPSTTSRRQRKGQRETTGTQRRRKSRSRSRSTNRGGRDTRRSSSRGSSVSPTRGRRRGGGDSRRRGPVTRSRSRSLSRASSAGGGIPPDKVGTAVRSVGRSSGGRLTRLLADAADPPVILLRGDANTLKCYRYRFRKKHAGGFRFVSTTWSWIGDASNDRIGRSRMLVAFYSESQREKFIHTMKLPTGVEWSLGQFDDL